MANAVTEMIWVEIVYALPTSQTLLNFEVVQGTTLEQGVMQSGIAAVHPELDLHNMPVGIFGKIAAREVVLREKDRIELYRPLLADPKEVRKQRAAEGKTMKNRGGKTESSA
ncbi:MAG: RnfH family protein [Leucothrix sp.]